MVGKLWLITHFVPFESLGCQVRPPKLGIFTLRIGYDCVFWLVCGKLLKPASSLLDLDPFLLCHVELYKWHEFVQFSQVFYFLFHFIGLGHYGLLVGSYYGKFRVILFAESLLFFLSLVLSAVVIVWAFCPRMGPYDLDFSWAQARCSSWK